MTTYSVGQVFEFRLISIVFRAVEDRVYVPSPDPEWQHYKKDQLLEDIMNAEFDCERTSKMTVNLQPRGRGLTRIS